MVTLPGLQTVFRSRRVLRNRWRIVSTFGREGACKRQHAVCNAVCLQYRLRRALSSLPVVPVRETSRGGLVWVMPGQSLPSAKPYGPRARWMRGSGDRACRLSGMVRTVSAAIRSICTVVVRHDRTRSRTRPPDSISPDGQREPPAGLGPLCSKPGVAPLSMFVGLPAIVLTRRRRRLSSRPSYSWPMFWLTSFF